MRRGRSDTIRSCTARVVIQGAIDKWTIDYRQVVYRGYRQIDYRGYRQAGVLIGYRIRLVLKKLV